MPLLVEMGWGGLVQLPDTITWTDISERVDVSHSGPGVAITRGAADEFSDTQPGSASLVLDNEDGALTPGNTGSPYYPFVRRNAPVRIAVATIPETSGPAPWGLSQLGDDFDDNVLDTALWGNTYGTTSEVGGRARVQLANGAYSGYMTTRQWTLTGNSFCVKLATVPAAGGSSSATVTIAVNSETAGTRLAFEYSPVAGTLRCQSDVAYSDAGATVLNPYQPIAHKWLRIREAGGTVYWETSSDGYAWTVRRSLATPAWVGTDDVEVELQGTRTGGATDYVEFDLAGATVWPRFYGQLNELPVRWDGLMSTVRVTATDLFKRLNRLPELRSCLTEEILLDAPDVYYPLTEPSDSTTAGDLSGTTAGALAITQAGSGGTLTFAAVDGPAATGEQMPQWAPAGTSNGKYLVGDLGATYEAATISQYNHVEFWFQTSLVAARAIIGIRSTNDDNQLVFSLTAGGALQIEYTNSGGSLTVVSVTTGNLADGGWHHVVYDEFAQTCYVDGVSKTVGAAVGLVYQLRHLAVGGYKATRMFEGSVSHIALYTVSDVMGPELADHYTAGATAYSGEDADDRIQRLVTYSGLAGATIYGTTHDPVAGQGPGGQTAMARMREVEATESAKLFPARDWYGIDYTSRDLRYNPSPAGEAFTTEYADLETGEVEVRDDDQKLINQVTAIRPGGAEQRVVAASSIAVYGPYPAGGGGTMSLLKTTDASVLDAAYWMVSRYADPPPEMREVPVEAYSHPEYLAILGADIGSYFSVTDLPAQAPAASVMVTVEGYTETIKQGSHRITFHTSATDNDSVWVLDDPTYSVLGSTTRLAY